VTISAILIHSSCVFLSIGSRHCISSVIARTYTLYSINSWDNAVDLRCTFGVFLRWVHVRLDSNGYYSMARTKVW
jgi:hypothetical protein